MGSLFIGKFYHEHLSVIRLPHLSLILAYLYKCMYRYLKGVYVSLEKYTPPPKIIFFPLQQYAKIYFLRTVPFCFFAFLSPFNLNFSSCSVYTSISFIFFSFLLKPTFHFSPKNDKYAPGYLGGGTRLLLTG